LCDDDLSAHAAFLATPCWLDDRCVQQSGTELSLNVDMEPEYFALSGGELVHNTFIHAPVTPLVTAPQRPRSQSLPRYVGRTSLESPIADLVSPADAMPPTPEMFALRTPEPWALPASASPVFDYDLESVLESQAFETPFWNESVAMTVGEIIQNFDGFIGFAYQQEMSFFISTFPPVPSSSAFPVESVPESRLKFGCVLDEVSDDLLIPQCLASPSPCWSREPPLLQQIPSAVQISLADHV